MQTPNIEGDTPNAARPNLDMIIAMPCFYLAKVVAMKIKESGYASVGLFFRNVPQSDLETILDKFAQIENNKLPKDDMLSRYTDLTLLAMLLGYGEGKTESTTEELEKMLQNMRRLAVVTLFDRKGKAVANYDKFSLIEPWDSKTIFTEVNNAP